MSLRTDVSVLYVDPRGPYPKLVADWWDEKRDARTYAGPNPIVAHPPCGPWGQFKHLSKHQPRDLAPLSIEQVRRWGGIVEHPRYSTLYRELSLPLPNELGDGHGWTVEVNQVGWGHPCIKPTWLYVVGVAPDMLWPGLRRSGKPTHRMTNDPRGVSANGDLKRASQEIRRRTPLAFAEWLIELASQAKPGGGRERR